MSDEIRTGLASQNDDGEILALINLIQPHVPWSQAHYDWQYERPTGGPARRYVARCDDRIVSLYVAVPHQAQLGGPRTRIWMVQDVMTHPDYRGRGMLHTLGEAAVADILDGGELGHTFPNALSRRSFGRIGWSDLGRVPNLSWVPDPVKAGESEIHELDTDPGTIQPVDHPGLLPAEAWAESGLTGVVRSSDYLQWRYSRPGTDYNFSVVGDGAGFVVTKWFASGDVKRLHVCDLVVRESERHRVAPALRRIMETGRSQGVTEVTAWCPARHPYRGAFLSAGFVPDEDPERHVFFTGATPGSNWHLSMGDSDVY